MHACSSVVCLMRADARNERRRRAADLRGVWRLSHWCTESRDGRTLRRVLTLRVS